MGHDGPGVRVAKWRSVPLIAYLAGHGKVSLIAYRPGCVKVNLMCQGGTRAEEEVCLR